MTIPDDRCSFSRCTGIPEIGYMGRPICGYHWEQICAATGKTENRLFKRIGLVRNRDGAVVPITNDEK